MTELPYTVNYLHRLFAGADITAPVEEQAGPYQPLLDSLYAECQVSGSAAMHRIWNESLSREFPDLASEFRDYERHKLHFYSPADLRSLPPVEYLYQDMIVKDGFNVIYGSPGAGKTFWALDIAVDVARTNRVVYFAGEGQLGFSSRLAAQAVYRKIDENKLRLGFCFDSIDISDEDRVGRMIEELRPEPPALIVVDTLARAVVDFEENSSKDMGIVIRNLDQVRAELGSSILLVHHCGHGEGHERGSSSLRGAADMMLKLKQGTRTIELECVKAKYDAPFERRHYRLVDVQFEDDRVDCILLPAEALDLIPAADRQLLEYLATTNAGALSAGIATATCVRSNALYKALARLKDNGCITQERKGAPFFITPKGRTVCVDAAVSGEAA